MSTITPSDLPLVAVGSSATSNPVGLCRDGAGNILWNSGSKLSKLNEISSFQNIPEIALARYRAIPNSTARKIAWVGDSTTDNLFLISVGGFTTVLGGTTTDYSWNAFSYPGGPFYNVTHSNFGANGAALAVYNNSALAAGKNLSDVVAFKPDLIVFSYGINDVRLGLTSLSQLVALITTAVNNLQNALPNADIILRMPNTFLYDAANTGGLIDAPTSLAKVQGYSDILRNAYTQLKGVFANTYVLDVQSGEGQLWHQKVQSTPGLYNISGTDAVHPGPEGYAVVIREIALKLGDYGSNRWKTIYQNAKPLLANASIPEGANAVSANAASPYYVYPRVLEDASKFNLILNAVFVAGAAGSYMDLSSIDFVSYNGNIYLACLKDQDIICQYQVAATTGGSQGEAIDNGVAAWKWTNVGISESGGNIRLTPLGAGYPLALNSMSNNVVNNVRVFRPRPTTQKNDYDPNIAVILGQATFAAGSLTQVVTRAGAIGAITAIAKTAPTTGGTITIAVNGTTIATLTFANSATSATGSGTFFTAGTRGIWLDEGDIVVATISAGFVAGTNLKVALSNT